MDLNHRPELYESPALPAELRQHIWSFYTAVYIITLHFLAPFGIRWGISTYKGKNRMVPRVRIELTTPAFSGPRSTTELPRHHFFKYYHNRR